MLRLRKMLSGALRVRGGIAPRRDWRVPLLLHNAFSFFMLIEGVTLRERD